MSSLKLVMAVSKDGFVSLGPEDDMLWTGPDDKRAFRLLTAVGGVLGAGRRTFEQLPRLKGRRVICLSTRRGFVENAPAREARQFPFGDGPIPEDAADLRKVYHQPLRRGRVLGHPRLAQNVWRLVLKALAQAFPEQRVSLPDDDSPEQDGVT